MIDHDTRTAILRLRRQGNGIRPIARALGVSRNTVKEVVKSGDAEVPRIERAQALSPHIDQIRALHAQCKGNLVRVNEELEARHKVVVPYSTLTGFCRRHEIGTNPKKRAGRYHFEAGEEMQHDTSPHRVKVAGRWRVVQCASLVLCFSRRIFAQVYPAFRRFHCKVFLTLALKHFGGAAGRAMLDNSSVVIASGTGKNAIPAAEMAAFAGRFSFEFAAHELGDANRSARVERPFDYIDNNFYPGRTFGSLADLNAQLWTWCEERDHMLKDHLGAKPIELFAAEQPELEPLPLHIPEVYDSHDRGVDSEGYVHLHKNRYSVPEALIDEPVEVRESIDRIRIFHRRRLVAEHEAREPGLGRRVTLEEHQGPGRRKPRVAPPLPEESVLRAAAPELGQLVDGLRKRHGGQAAKTVRRLHRFFLDYPTEPLVDAVRTANEYGLLDLGRIERMVLRRIAGDFFRLPTDPDHDTSEDDDA